VERSPAAGCEAYREALSARLDGEVEPIDAALTDAHLLRCAGCRAWHADAAAAIRLFRVQQVVGHPAGPDDLLAALDAHGVLPAETRKPSAVKPRFRGAAGRWVLVAGLRVLLGAFGAAQFVLGIAQVTDAATATDLHGSGSGHLWHESAAWNVAIGAGFGWIASRRGRPAGALPMLTAFVALLALLSVNDVLAGRVETARLLSHGFVLAGYAIVVALTRPALDPGRPPSRLPVTPPWRDDTGDDSGGDAPPPPRLRLVPGQATARATDREAA
jgi:predicted anti-sigma-YlaC factor YlaD